MINGKTHVSAAGSGAMHFRIRSRLFSLLIFYFWLLTIGVPIAIASAVQAAQPPVHFEQKRIWIETAEDRFEFQVEIAATPAQRSRGLMFRDHLAADRGMLFDFGQTQPVTMWMRNTLIPLDMLFVRDDGRISRIVAETEPLSDRVIGSGEPVRAVLELPGGRAAELDIQPGDRIVHPMFSER
jgi:uncharacterized membrane protein (UPF0127 family)